MESLASKYRPKTFDEIVGQTAVVKNLLRQLETNTFKNTYLFCGPSGDGKTTIARVFAKTLNGGLGTPIEIDGASNNGVDNVRAIIDESKTRALDSEYKVIIIDECHAITTQGWQAFLKCIEEPSPYTIFIFCTTDPQKIPATILNRVMRFNLTRISTEEIRNRLMYISSVEGFSNYAESCDYIARLSCGGMRDAIAMLEKCAGYSNNLDLNNVIYSLGNFSYETFLDLTNYLVDGNEAEVIRIIDSCYDAGGDIKLFIEQYLDFVLDLNKYCLFQNIDITKIPTTLENPKYENDTRCVKYAVGFDGSTQYLNKLADRLLSLKMLLKSDTMPRTTATITLVNICRGI